jgi:tetratricopeptide (TPR) repeat protein
MLAILAALALARLALAFGSGTWGWGLDLLRHAPPALGFALWAAAAVLLLRPVARRAEPWLGRAGEAREAPAFWALTTAVLVLLLPNRTLFVGDFLLRSIASHTTASTLDAIYPQGLPLDAWLHDGLGRALARATGTTIATWWRALGALEAGMLAALAAALARALGARGAGAFAVAALLVSGGHLTLFTGYNKAFVELTVLTPAIGLAALWIARGAGDPAAARRTGLAFLALSAMVAFGLLTHRLALAFLPVWLLAAWLALRGASRALWAASAALPMIALAVVAPRLLGAAGIDQANFLPERVRRAGVLAATFEGLHLLDLANALLFLAPLAPLVLLAPWAARASREASRARDLPALLALVLPLLAFAPFFRPPQGLIRDWDALAPTAAALSLLAAWCVARVLAVPARAWLAVPLAAAAIAPAITTLTIHHDLGRGITRVATFVRQPPARPEHQRATVWDWIGTRYLDVGLADSAAAAYAEAAAIAPSPRILRQWAAAEIARGRLETAQAIYRRAVERKSDHLAAWLELGLLSLRMGDTLEARRAARAAAALDPSSQQIRALLDGVGVEP